MSATNPQQHPAFPSVEHLHIQVVEMRTDMSHVRTALDRNSAALEKTLDRVSDAIEAIAQVETKSATEAVARAELARRVCEVEEEQKRQRDRLSAMSLRIATWTGGLAVAVLLVQVFGKALVG